ncbi:MAG: glycosyltransferase family 39 protein [Patescibacteria group bacterium]
MFFKRLLRSNFIFLFIIFCAALFRVTNLDLIEFKADEAINLFLASRPFFGYGFPPGGTASSVGILNPPLFNYILFPFIFVTRDPKLISLSIALINSFAIGLFYLLIKRYYNFLTAFSASLLFAFSPWAILFSRKIWSQDILIPFFILVLYSLHKIIFEKKISYWVPCIVGSLFLIQMHQSSILFLFLLALFLFRQKIIMSIKYMTIGFLIGILPIIPYFLYEATTGCPDCAVILGINERLSPQYSLVIFTRPLQILSQGNFNFVLGDDMLTFAKNFPLIYYLRVGLYIEYILIPLGLFLFWRKERKVRFLVYAALSLPLLYFVLRFEPFMHYFILLMPLLFLFLGFSFSIYLTNKIQTVRHFFSFIFLLLIIISITFNYAFFEVVKTQKTIKGDYGTIYAVTRKGDQKMFAKYKNSKEYEEVTLTNYVPKYLIHGDLPVAKMIYKFDQIRKDLPLLEKNLHENPQDPRIQNALIAYYTSSPITKSTVSFLRNKYKKFPEYGDIYEETYRKYLTNNKKRLYRSTFGFFLEYPSDWNLKENVSKQEIKIKNGPYIFSLSVIPIEKIPAIIKNDSYLVKLRNYYLFPQYRTKNSLEARKLMDQITQSIRE